MNKIVQEVLEKLNPLFESVDEVMNEWANSNNEGNLQFPTLLGMMAVRLQWNEKQVREYDPLIRYYVRNNPNWYVTRGAHGGIMRVTDKQKKEAERQAKEVAKAQVKAAVEAKAAAMTAVATTNSISTASVITDELDESEEVEDSIDSE